MAKDVGAKVETSKYTGRIGVSGKVIGKVEKAPVSTWAAAKRDRVEGSFGRAVEAAAAKHSKLRESVEKARDASGIANRTGKEMDHAVAAKANYEAATAHAMAGDKEGAALHRGMAATHDKRAGDAVAPRSDLQGRIDAVNAKTHAGAYAASDKANDTGLRADHRTAANEHTRAAGAFQSGDPRKQAHLNTAANHEEAARTGAKAAGVSGDDRPRDERGRFASK